MEDSEICTAFLNKEYEKGSWILKLKSVLKQLLSCTCNFSFSRTTWVKWIDNGLLLISHGPKTSRLQKLTLAHARLYIHNLQTKKPETLLYLRAVCLKTIEVEKVQSLNWSQTEKKMFVSSKYAKSEAFKVKISFLMFKFSRAVCLKNIELEKVQNSNRKKKSVRLVQMRQIWNIRV